MVTMSDVARVAEVSQSTVSHVINKTRKVHPDTERAVLAAIEATGYWGDGVARSLRRGTTETIGLAMSAISNPYFGNVVQAMERSISRAGYSLLLADTHDDSESETRAVVNLLSHRVDAMIIAPSADPDQTLDILSKRSIPTVLIDRVPEQPRKGMDAIGVTNEGPNALLVDHLVEIGHRRIATITSRPGIRTTVERLDGYWAGLDRNNIVRDRALVRVGDDGAEGAADRAVEELLALKDPPTAIVMGNNQVTIATLAALRARRVEVPRDLALVAFDDFPWADLFHPRLTAMSQPVEELGRGAVQLLFERLGDRDLPSRQVRLEPTFVHRESCGCHPAAD